MKGPCWSSIGARLLSPTKTMPGLATWQTSTFRASLNLTAGRRSFSAMPAMSPTTVMSPSMYPTLGVLLMWGADSPQKRRELNNLSVTRTIIKLRGLALPTTRSLHVTQAMFGHGPSSQGIRHGRHRHSLTDNGLRPRTTVLVAANSCDVAINSWLDRSVGQCHRKTNHMPQPQAVD